MWGIILILSVGGCGFEVGGLKRPGSMEASWFVRAAVEEFGEAKVGDFPFLQPETSKGISVGHKTF